MIEMHGERVRMRLNSRFGVVAAEQIILATQNRFLGDVARSLVSVLKEISHIGSLYVYGKIIC
jgi:hypothetical protein